MKKLFKILFIYLLFIIYLYQIVFKVLPISSKFIIYGLGFIFSLPKLLSNKYALKREYVSLLKFCILIAIWDLIVCLMNFTHQFYLTKGLVSVVASFFGANLLYDISKSYLRSNTAFLQVVVITIAAHSLYAIAMKFIPPLYALADTVQVFLIPKEYVGDDIELMERFIGLGTACYFSALLPCALGLNSSVRLLGTTNNTWIKACYIIMYVVTAAFTFLTARTTILLVVLSIVFLFAYYGLSHFSKILKFLIVLPIIVSTVFYFANQYLDLNTITWALEIFTEKDSGSSGLVKEWWLNTKFPFKTLLVGDGLYSLGEFSYYKSIDIGIHRKIFYGGIMGLVLDLVLHYKTLNYIRRYDNSRETKLLILSFFLSYIIILCKGDANMMSLFILYLVFYSKGIFTPKFSPTR